MTGYPPEACSRIIKERIVVVECMNGGQLFLPMELVVPFAAIVAAFKYFAMAKIGFVLESRCFFFKATSITHRNARIFFH
jgi:hypothetical protein